VVNEPAGRLYVVATPIGNLGDLSARARAVLSSCALIAAEDTRHTGVLLKHFGIQTPQVSLHDHNEQHRSGGIIELVRLGRWKSGPAPGSAGLVAGGCVVPGHRDDKACHRSVQYSSNARRSAASSSRCGEPVRGAFGAYR